MTRNGCTRRRRVAARLLATSLLGGCAAGREAAPALRGGDYAVYAAVLRAHLTRPRPGEHGLLCEDDHGPAGELAAVGHTRRLWLYSRLRDSAAVVELLRDSAVAQLPGGAARLLAALRALDRQPQRVLDADSLRLGAPVHLVPELPATRTVRAADRGADDSSGLAPPVAWLSRVAYTADSSWALVYAGKVCPERTEEEAEPGAYGWALLVPLRWRAGGWTALDPVFLETALEPVYLEADRARLGR